MSAINHALETLVPGQEPTASDFYKANFRGYLGKIVATLTRRSNQLQEAEALSGGIKTRSSHYRGQQTVRIDQIKGSEGRCEDFDRNFHPLKIHNRDRWLSIARACFRGVALPAVELIQIGEVYIVRDGHHRISVASFMGAAFIDARVTEWVLGD